MDPALPFRIREANPSDTASILGLIRELAEYERLGPEVVATEEELARWLFGPDRVPEVRIAEVDPSGPDLGGDPGRPQGEVAGFALFFPSFSTFLGRPGIWLEDLYVRPRFRGRGIGRALLAHLAELTRERGWGRLEWSVLDWNEPAIGFYRALGARPMEDWTTFRLTGEALRALAERGRTSGGGEAPEPGS